MSHAPSTFKVLCSSQTIYRLDVPSPGKHLPMTYVTWLQNEENKMLSRQQQEEPPQPPANATEAGEQDKSSIVLPSENGQGDTLPLSSGILQVGAPANR